MGNSKGLASIMLIAATVIAGVDPASAEEDHLEGYKIKDLNRIVPPANPYVVSNQFGIESCELKRPLFFMVQSEKNGGDDPRGGATGELVCYKAKCTGSVPPLVNAESQFGVHQLESKKAKLVCLPVDAGVCGDGDIDPGEMCDGNDGACPGNCQSDCTCAPSTCPSGGGEPNACLAYIPLSSTSCYDCCNAAGAACQSPCSEVVDPHNLICVGTAAQFDACSSAINAAGCGPVCCF